MDAIHGLYRDLCISGVVGDSTARCVVCRSGEGILQKWKSGVWRVWSGESGDCICEILASVNLQIDRREYFTDRGLQRDRD